MKTWIVFFASLFYCGLALADEPPSWQNFEIKSANGKYKAEVFSADETKNLKPRERKYKINVSDTAKPLSKVLWFCDYDYDGYPSGILSEDGSTFVYINDWFYDNKPVVSIYRNGSKVGSLTGKDFKIPKLNLKNTTSHQLWLYQEGTAVRLTGTQEIPIVLEIVAIDKKIHKIDVRNGQFLK